MKSYLAGFSRLPAPFLMFTPEKISGVTWTRSKANIDIGLIYDKRLVTFAAITAHLFSERNFAGVFVRLDSPAVIWTPELKLRFK